MLLSSGFLIMDSTQTSVVLQPLGAGDLIDRAVRLYRRNFFTLIRIAALPVVVSTIGSVLLTLGWRGFYTTGAEISFALYFLLVAAGIVLWLVGNLLTLMVMGGAARNLVRHLLWNEPVTVRETFRSVRSRFWSLLWATILVGIIVFLIAVVCFYGWTMLLSFTLLISLFAASLMYALGVIVGVVLGLAATLAALWLFFMLAGKFAYVPQVLLVEGQGVMNSIGRSVVLAKKNWRRLAALVLFTTFATYSALMVLYLPLVWYAESVGIPLSGWFSNQIPPVWYSVAMQAIWQLSFILLAPIWMLGLSVMYVDARVRLEAYDVELLAARSLGEMPPLANPQHNPLRPALGRNPQLPPPNFGDFSAPAKNSTLSLR